MKKFFSLVLALVMALSLTTVAWGADPVTYYVSNAGDDNAAGTEGAPFETIAKAIESAADGDTIKLLTDIEDVVATFSDKSLTIDLGTKTLKGKITVDTTKACVIKNGTIDGTASGRGIVTFTDVNLSVEDVVINVTGTGNTQGLTISGYDTGTSTVYLKNCDITATTAGYAIIGFTKTNLTIDACDITGYAAIYMKNNSLGTAGSAGSVVTVKNGSTLTGVNSVSEHPSNSFSTVVFEENNVTINIDASSTVTATKTNSNGQAIFGLGTATGNPDVSNVKINVADGAVLTGQLLAADAEGIANNTVTLPAEYADELVADVAADGYTVLVTTDGTAVIVPAVTSGDKFDLYQADKNMNTMLTLEVPSVAGLSFDEKPAKVNQDGSGNVAYIVANNGQYFVKTTTPYTTSYAVTYAGKTDVLYYVNVGGSGAAYYAYEEEVTAFADFGKKCGQVDITPVADKTYFKASDKLVYMAGAAGTGDNYLLNGVVVSAATVGKAAVDHSFSATDFQYDAVKKVNVPTEATCTKCLAQTSSIYLDGKVPATYTRYPLTNGGKYVVGLANPTVVAPVVVPSTPSKVESAETFDAGIAMYVGMSVMAAAGSAVVIGKKKD